MKTGLMGREGDLMGKEPPGISKDDSCTIRKHWEFSRKEILNSPS